MAHDGTSRDYELPHTAPFTNEGKTQAGWVMFWGVCLGGLVVALGVVLWLLWLVIVGIVLAFNAVKSLGPMRGIARMSGAMSYPLYLVHQLAGYVIIAQLIWAGVPLLARHGVHTIGLIRVSGNGRSRIANSRLETERIFEPNR